MLKRIITILLATVMLLPLLASCGAKNDSDKPTGGGELTKTGTIVPEDVTFSGETFTILCREDNAWGEYLHEIEADENATELVNEAVYKRNLEVEERLELEELKAYAIPGQWAVYEDFTNTFRNSVLSASASFDLVMSQQAYMADASLMDLYVNFYEIPYVKDNLSADHYFEDIIEEMTIDGKLLYMLSDYSLTYWEQVYVMYFNKEIHEDNNLEDIYQLVRDGDWTYDKMAEMSKGLWVDNNNDNWPDEGDSYGYVTEIPNATDALWDLFDIRMTSKNENGEIIIDVDAEKMVNVLQDMISFKKENYTYFAMTSSSDTIDSNPVDKIFREGRALFYPERLMRAQYFRDMETEFGIVPYPKYDANQAGYYTRAQNGYSIAVVPIDAPNLELTGAAYDLLSAISNANVIPAYYDMALKDKYSRDNESGEMLDIIREGFRTSFGDFYGPTLDMGNEFRVLIESENSNFVSYYEVNKKGFERKLRELMKAYEELDVE